MSALAQLALAIAFAQATTPPSEEAEPLDERLGALEERVAEDARTAITRAPRWTLSGYVDLGFFVPQGTGAGLVQDLGPPEGRAFPEYADRYAWVFLGDILAPAINSRGEPADLGDVPDSSRFDAVDSRGAPGFIANEVNLAIRSAVAESALVTASVNFAPRSGSDFRQGDQFDVDLAELEWLLGSRRRTSIFVGKVEPVFGIEYRERKADRRFGITPSLIARYTMGTPLGLKVRSKLGPGDRVVVAAALTNGSSGTETFHFHDEIDSNAGKTASARLSFSPPGPIALEVGLSGEYGPQDRVRDSEHALWFVGVDLQARLWALTLKSAWMRGRAPGEEDRPDEPGHRAFGLRLAHGGYAELDWAVNRRFGALVRAELRDALVWLGNPASPEGAERLYVTRSWRATVGARVNFTDWALAKGEYLHNGEYGGVPAIRNDIFTTSLVLVF